LPEIIDVLQKEGFEFVTIDKILEDKEKEAELKEALSQY
jgi:peptidoglycan/xylan/chitin deacetylase (PgdA/CDA1 family)